MKVIPLFTLLTFGLVSGPLTAAITYIDATMANTDIASGGPDSLWADGDDGTTGGTVADGSANNDGKWRYRDGFGGNGLWEATGSTATVENAAEIVTTATGLANGTYNVFVFFVAVTAYDSGDNNREFPIRAGFSSNPGANQIFTQVLTTNVPAPAIVGTDASTLSFANTFTPGTAGDSRPNLAGDLGQIEVTDGTLSVYVDDLHAVNDSDERTWYTGIGYEIVPEPSVALLGALGSLMLLRRRRL